VIPEDVSQWFIKRIWFATSYFQELSEVETFMDICTVSGTHYTLTKKISICPIHVIRYKYGKINYIEINSGHHLERFIYGTDFRAFIKPGYDVAILIWTVNAPFSDNINDNQINLYTKSIIFDHDFYKDEVLTCLGFPSGADEAHFGPRFINMMVQQMDELHYMVVTNHKAKEGGSSGSILLKPATKNTKQWAAVGLLVTAGAKDFRSRFLSFKVLKLILQQNANSNYLANFTVAFMDGRVRDVHGSIQSLIDENTTVPYSIHCEYNSATKASDNNYERTKIKAKQNKEPPSKRL